MIDSASVLGLITARGGSKAVPGKNLRPLAGRPLLAWSIAAAKASRLVDRLILSSDDAKIIAAAREAGCEVPFVRPAELASDSARSVDVAKHAIRALDGGYEYVALIQPTSPFVTGADIDGTIRRCHERGANSCVTVRPVEENPAWMYRIMDAGVLVPLLPGPRPSQRQGLAPAHILNGAVFVARCSWLLERNDFLDEATVAFEMPPERSIDIDILDDFALAEAALAARRV